MTYCIDPGFYRLLADNYSRFLGQPLVPGNLSVEESARWLYEDAPFGILAHNAAQDPIFVYGNKQAQSLFEYTWSELITLPSRLSAEAPERGERQAFLEQVSRHGFVTGYRGIRVKKSGARFWIEKAVVWQLFDNDEKYRGQAAMIPYVTDITDIADIDG